MNKDYETPNFKTPPKKPIFTISKSAIRLTSTPNSSNHDEISLEDVEKKIYEIVTNAVNSGLTNQKIEEIKERAYKDIIKSFFLLKNNIYKYFFQLDQKFSINRLVKEQDRLVKIVQENLDEKINQKHQGFYF